MGFSHHHRLHVLKHKKRDCFPFCFYFNTNECIYTHRGKIQERPELPPPPYDPPAVPFRRDTYCFTYGLSLDILLLSTFFEISVIITHFLVEISVIITQFLHRILFTSCPFLKIKIFFLFFFSPKGWECSDFRNVK